MGTMTSAAVKLFMIILGAVVQVYTYISLPFYHLLQNPSKCSRLSRALRSRQLNPTDPYSPYVRTGSVPHHPLTKCQTIVEALEQMKKLYSMDRHCVGYRSIIEESIVMTASGEPVMMDGKVVRQMRLTDYRWLTYQEVNDTCIALAKGLRVNGFAKYTKCVVFSDTCVENLLFLLAALYNGIVCVGVFSNLGDDGIIHAINQTEAQAVFTSYDLLDRVVNLSAQCPTINKIIYIPRSSTAPTINTNISTNNDPMRSPSCIELIPFPKLIFDGTVSGQEAEIDSFDKEDVILIGYTSGTNGPPKGVYVTLSQIREAALALLPACEKFIAEPERHIYVAYLPQVHVLEASIELIAFIGGCRIGYANPLTLNESAPGLARGVVCDLKLLKPTIMAGVPLVLDRMRKEMYVKLSQRTPFSTDVFNYLTKYKIYWTQKGYTCPIVDLLLCSKVKEQFGGRLEQFIVGGAPLSPQLQALIKASLNVRLIQGYGATELSGAVLAMDHNDLSYGRCGAPLAGIQIRLDDWYDGGYTVRDYPNPRGEIIVGGPGISFGYYNNQELTDQFYECDYNGLRWFRTGDIGEVFPDGTFSIIDRKKDLIKLSNGEYFSLGKIEACLKNSRFVDNICVVGKDSYLIALVATNRQSMQTLARDLCIGKGATFAEICRNCDVIETVHKDMVDIGLDYGLHRRELPLRIWLCEEEWTPDNGLLTAALKLKRFVILKKYCTIIESLTDQ